MFGGSARKHIAVVDSEFMSSGSCRTNRGLKLLSVQMVELPNRQKLAVLPYGILKCLIPTIQLTLDIISFFQSSD